MFDPFAGNNQEGKPVYLRDIWPTRSQIQEVEKQVIVPALYNKVYGSITVCAFLLYHHLGVLMAKFFYREPQPKKIQKALHRWHQPYRNLNPKNPFQDPDPITGTPKPPKMSKNEKKSVNNNPGKKYSVLVPCKAGPTKYSYASVIPSHVLHIHLHLISFFHSPPGNSPTILLIN